PPSTASTTAASWPASTPTATATPTASSPPRSTDPSGYPTSYWPSGLGQPLGLAPAPGQDGLGPGRRQRPAEPGLDDVPGDRHRRRQHDLAGLDGGEQLVPAEPVRLGDL